MLSRVADSLYWLGRYSERAYTNAHIANVQIDQMLELGNKEEQQWNAVLSICGYMDDYKTRYQEYKIPQMMYFLLSDPENYNSIDQLLLKTRNNVKNTRDCIPNALFEEWNSLYLSSKEMPLQQLCSVLEATEFLMKVRNTSLTATGIIDSLMTRDECYLFVKIGKWLERSEKTALILLKLLEDAEELNRDFAVIYALQLTNTFDEYTRRFRRREVDLVLHFLIGDAKCSRSVAYGIRKIKKAILEIERYEIRPYAEELFATIVQLQQLVEQNPTSMNRIERKQWVGEIHKTCIKLGPIFSQMYYLTKPILVK